MHYLALACDYDGTIATDGALDAATIQALERLLESGRKLILVTGREFDDLQRVCPRLDLFDRVVAENGALLYRPASKEAVPLAPPPPDTLITALRAAGAAPLSVGHAIVATREPHQTAALEAIKSLGLEHQIIFNKGAVMILPPGVNKASGLAAALDELCLSPLNLVGVGDAENDHAFLATCGVAVAVANALPMLRDAADLVTENARGAGVAELVDRMIASDLAELDETMRRHALVLGERLEDGAPITIPAPRVTLLLAGTSGGGKSTLTGGLLERLTAIGYQFCIIDPEGDYETFPGAVILGGPGQPVEAEKVLQVLQRAEASVVVNMLGIALADRPGFFSELMPRLQSLRVATGRPHWLVIDEAHHMLPVDWEASGVAIPAHLGGVMMITVHPDKVAREALKHVSMVLSVGKTPDETIASFAASVGEAAPEAAGRQLESGTALVWRRGADAVDVMTVLAPSFERRRHIRKYAEGQLAEERSFFFRGPEGKLNLRAQNLQLFLQLGDGVDDDTWLHHLKEGDYSRWFRDCIKDDELAAEAEEAEGSGDPAESRKAIREAVERRYTAPA